MNDKTKTSTLGAGVLGAAIGAAAGVAVTKIMSDPKMKSQATTVIKKAKEYALNGVDQARKKAEEWQSVAEDAKDETRNKVERISRNAKSV